MKVVVVGNSASLMGRGLGKIIDGFDFVVRFNNFKIEGFEKDVGTKTTHWMVALNQDMLAYFKKTGHQPFMDKLKSIWIREGDALDKLPKFIKNIKPPKHVEIETMPFLLKELAHQYLQAWPSSGLLAFIFLSYKLPDARIYYTGIWESSDKDYFDINYKIWDGHSREKESQLLAYWAKLKLIYPLAKKKSAAPWT